MHLTGNLYLLPGLGADRRMYAGQRGRIPNFRVIEWDPPRRGESIRAYATRFAKRIPPGPFAIGGVSLGGVIAQEIAALRRPEALIIIATLKSSREIFAPFRLGRLAPDWAFDFVTWGSQNFAPLAAPLYGSRGRHTRAIARMLADADPRFVSWARRAILDWEAPGTAGIPTLQIHGTRDVLLWPKDTSGIVWIQGAGHLMNMTHAARVNREIRRFLAGEVRSIPAEVE